MRDTKALKLARESEADPYVRRFGVPKWSRTVTVIDDHRLFRSLSEFATWTKTQHETEAKRLMGEARNIRLAWEALCRLSVNQYGNGTGVYISGVYREHFPSERKDELRRLAQDPSRDRSIAHWQAAGRTIGTWQRECLGLESDDRPIGQRTR